MLICQQEEERDRDGEEKKFTKRASVLTDLFEKDANIRSLRQLCWAVAAVAALDSLLRSGRGRLIATEGFRGTFVAIPVWIAMMATTLLAHFLCHHWRNVWYGAFTSGGCGAILLFGEEIGIGWRFALLFEQVRQLMKVHSYWRRNDNGAETSPPTFGRFVYFLFAPTLLYRAEYPRTSGPINWRLVAEHLAEFGGGVFLTAFNLEAFFVPLVSLPAAERGTLCWRMFGAATIPALCQLIVGNYLLLHAWQNAWAEMLRFGDRYFYGEWWSAVNYTEYYRRWNGIVHDWLKEYVYSAVLRTKSTRANAALAVFVVSAVVHEYMIGMALRFFYPVMFLEFAGFGVLFAFIRPVGKQMSAVGNAFFWLSLSTGSAMQMVLYAAEMRARVTCPSHPNRFIDPFIPRSLYCDSF